MNVYSIRNYIQGGGAIWALLNKDDLHKYVDKVISITQQDLTNKKVLDIGCGECTMLKYLYDKYKIQPYGVDLSPINISICQNKLPIGHFVKGDLIKYLESVPDKSIDFIIMYGVLPYFEDVDKVVIINHINRILKHGSFAWIGGNMKMAMYAVKPTFWTTNNFDNMNMIHFSELDIFNNTKYSDATSTILKK